MERASGRAAGVLAFGVDAIDAALPGGGLALGALHEAASGGADEVHAAAAALFAAGILARLKGPAVWCGGVQDLFAPGLACAGLHPDRVLQVDAQGDKAVMAAMEEALRHPGVAGVAGELATLPMTASRRLKLAAESSGALALAIRRRPEGRDWKDGPNAASTRWRISPLPSSPLGAPGIGRARWRVELTRCRGGEAAEWIMEACDATGRLDLPAELADRPAAQAAA
jgi:protein ImuA